MRKMNFKSILAIALSMVMAFPVSVSATEDGFTCEEDLSENAGEDLAEEVTATLPEEETVGDSAAVPEILSYGGGFESIYATIANVSDEQVTAVSYEGTMSGQLSGDDLKYLVREVGNGKVRVDIPGLKRGDYTLKITANNLTMTREEIHVRSYNRSGYAHFNYYEGVGAYNDDGTLKDNAIVLYVTDENKNDVKLTVGSKAVTGIGNILNSAGASGSGERNTNNGIIRELAKKNIPLAVRIIGSVKNLTDTADPSSKALIEGLTAYDSADYGGSEGDNGGMARMKGGKNITIEGIGTDAVADGWGFHFIAEDDYGKSFELRNLTFRNTPEDAVGMEGVQSGTDLTAPVERCWIHNNEFYCPSFSAAAESDKREGDGSCDFKRGRYLTVAYNYFEGCHKTCLVGADYSNYQHNLTYHHNYWNMCSARGPLVRRANIHMYNNFIFGQKKNSMDVRADSYIFSEYNLFYMCKNPSIRTVEKDKKSEYEYPAGVVKSYMDSYAGYIGNRDAVIVQDKNQYVDNDCSYDGTNDPVDYSHFDTDSRLSYIPVNDYSLQTDVTALRKTIAADTGVLKAESIDPEDVSMEEISVFSRVNNVNSDLFEIQGTDLPYDFNMSDVGNNGKIENGIFVFSIPTECDITVAYSSDSHGSTGILVNEAGVELLTGSGKAESLPAGKYAIQPDSFETENGLVTGSFKSVRVSSLKAESVDPNYDPNKLTGIEMNKSKATLGVGDSIQLSYSTVPSTAVPKSAAVWTSLSPSVVSVSDSGLVSALTSGKATVKAEVDGHTAECVVTVNAKNIKVSYAIAQDGDGTDSYVFNDVFVSNEATVADLIDLAQTDKDIREVKMASNGGYETVDLTATLTENGQYVFIFERENPKVEVNSITLDPAADFELNVDETKTITATVKPDNATDKTVTWKSSVPGVATVDGGVVTAKAEGETVISATAGGKSASLKVTVKKPSGGQSGEGGGQSGEGGGQSGEGGGQSGEGGGQSGEGGGQSGEGGGQSGEGGGQSGEGGGESGGGDKPVPVPVPDTKVKLPVVIGEKTYNVEYTDKPQFTGAKITLSDITFEGAKPGEVIPGTAVLFKSVKYKNNKNAGKNASAVIVLKAQKMEDKAANDANKAAVKAANNAFKANPIIFEIAQCPLASDKISGTAEYNAKRSSWKFKLFMDVSGAKPLKLKFNKKAEKTDFTVDPAFAPGEDGSYPATVKLTGNNNFTGSADVNVTVRQ